MISNNFNLVFLNSTFLYNLAEFNGCIYATSYNEGLYFIDDYFQYNTVNGNGGILYLDSENQNVTFDDCQM